MLEITKLGENTLHDAAFHIDRPNGHPVYLLLLVGTPAAFYINGSWQSTPPHTAVLFKPGQMHRYKAADSTYRNSWAHLQTPHPILNEHFPFGTPVLLHNPDTYYDLFHVISNEYYGVTPHRNLILHNLMTALLNKIADESNTLEYPALYYSLTAVREQIYNFPDRAWNVPMIAAQLNISAGYLHALYRHYFNTTCIKDVIQSRMQAACELLHSSDKSLNEIAELCGYQYTEHFIRQFKANIGVTPNKFRKGEVPYAKEARQ